MQADRAAERPFAGCGKWHTVVLGWGPQFFSIISELVIAKENQKNGVIIVLSSEDKVSMEDEIRLKIGPTGRPRVVCRTGNPIDPDDLEITSLETARAVIIPAPDADDADTHAIKYRLKREAENPGQQYGVHLNPLKSEALEFEVDDRVIVLAES